MRGQRDRVARALAAIALAVALAALVTASYAVHLGSRYLEDVRVLGESLEGRLRLGNSEIPLRAPPPQLATD